MSLTHATAFTKRKLPRFESHLRDRFIFAICSVCNHNQKTDSIQILHARHRGGAFITIFFTQREQQNLVRGMCNWITTLLKGMVTE